MHRWISPLLSLFLLFMVCSLSIPANAAAKKTSFAVAPFEQLPKRIGSGPDVASQLAQRLRVAGVSRIVTPQEFNGPVPRRPDSATIKSWGRTHQVETVVIGRTTRIGQQLSIDVQLRSSKTGGVVATIIEEVSSSAELGEAVDRIAKRVLELAHSEVRPAVAAGPGTPQVQAAPKASSPPKADSSAPQFGNRDEPMSITADELEVVTKEGGRTIVFRGNVKLDQGPLHLTSKRLNAVYKAGASEPDEIVATKNVVIVQSGKKVSCDKATYYRASQKVLCRGHASMKQGDDQAWGEEIEFQLDTERLLIHGGAKVVITPDEKKSGAGS